MTDPTTITMPDQGDESPSAAQVLLWLHEGPPQISKATLSKLFGVSEQTVGRVMKGSNRANPGLRTRLDTFWTLVVHGRSDEGHTARRLSTSHSASTIWSRGLRIALEEQT